MKNIVVSRGKFEIARTSLNKSSILIGRSPTCDLVVRAPGVQPIHFLVEWVGVGDFNPDIDNWIVFDISHATGNDYSAEGLLIPTDKKIELGNFVFFLEKTSFAQAHHLGGAIQKEITGAAVGSSAPVDKKLLEVVWIRSDSGAIEDVSHYVPSKITKKTLPVEKFPDFKFQMQSSMNLKLFFEHQGDVKVFSKGELVERGHEELKLNDFYQVQWKKESIFLRFVDVVPSPPIDRERIDGLLLKISLISSAIFTLLLLLTLIPTSPKPEEETPEAPRVARIEVKEIVDAPKPVAPPPPPITEKLNKKEEPAPKELKAGIKNLPSNKSPGRAAAPRFKSADGAPRLGLNSPAKSADVNQVGILGVLNNKKAAKGPGVRADLIINQGVQADVIAGNQGNVVIKNPPSGVIGTGNSGDPRGSGKGTGNLAAATTLRGAGEPDATSLGTIARRGGKAGADLGTSLDGNGKGLGGGNERGAFDTGDMSVVGGLDKETVRRVIAAHRGKIRVCYDKALVSNPKVAGRIVYKWTISPAGPVSVVNITKSLASSPVLEQCVLGVVKSMVFPRAPNGMPTTVIYPFEFFAKN